MPATRATKLTATCRICKINFELMVNENDFRDWQAGTLIQRAMPYLSPAERELLITSTCGDCFDKMFRDED